VHTVEHIYRLADEYQIENVMVACRNFLSSTTITSQNATKILVLSQVCKADGVRQKCYQAIQKLTVNQLESDQDFEDLDEESLRNVLLPKAKRLEECIKSMQPQLIGLIDCVLYLWLSDNNKNKMGGMPRKCPLHFWDNTTSTPMQGRMGCDVCKSMLGQMAIFSKSSGGFSTRSTIPKGPYYGSGGMYFDETIVSVLQETFNLLKT
jgi:hypothetical protein